jgi:hypothetical protein
MKSGNQLANGLALVLTIISKFMPIDIKQISLDAKKISIMDLRNSPGEILDKVAKEGEAFIIERKGEYLACLVPVYLLYPNIKREVISDELDNLHKNNEHPKIRLTDKNELELKFSEMIMNQKITIKVILPHGYPNIAPKIYAEPLDKNVPHIWQDGSLTIYGAYKNWEPDKDNILFTLKLIRKWLFSYSYWKKAGVWNE